MLRWKACLFGVLITASAMLAWNSYEDQEWSHQRTVRKIEAVALENHEPHFKSQRVVIGGCARNVAQFLPKVFSNVSDIARLFSDYHIIVYHDIADEPDTLRYLRDYEAASGDHMTVIDNPAFVSEYRTYRLAYGRNRIVKEIETRFGDYDLYINLDLDDRSAKRADLSSLVAAIEQGQDWDVLTFARRNGRYYDLWALRFEPFMANLHDYPSDVKTGIREQFRQAIDEKIAATPKDQFIEVESAFNGIGVYRIVSILGCRYDGTNTLHAVPNGLGNREDCEHVAFHREMKTKNGARIVISPRAIF